MAAAGEGYEGTGAGGKFRKKPHRRSQTTPYDRPHIGIRNPSIIAGGSDSFLSKLVDPASKLIYAGARRLFGVFRKRLTLPTQERLTEPNHEPNDRLGDVVINLSDSNRAPEQLNNQNGDSANTSSGTEISELEKMLKHRNFTRSEIERLTELLRSRTSDLPVDNEGRTEEPKFQSSPLNQNSNRTDIFRASVSTPVTSSVVLNEDIASPAELAKAYMGNRGPSKASPTILLSNASPLLSNGSPLLSNGSVFPKSPTSLRLSLASEATKGAGIPENGFTTPRSRGRSALYGMARSRAPYSRIHSTDGDKGIVSYGGPSSSLIPTLSAREQEGLVGSKQTALKRRSSVLEDDIGSVGSNRRIRQKPNILSQGGFLSARVREYGSRAAQYQPSSSDKLLITSEAEHKIQKPVEKNGATDMSFSRYGLVPSKSSEMANRILQHLEKLSPKEKQSQNKGDPSGTKSPSKLTSTMLHGKALRSMDTLDSSKFLNNLQVGHKFYESGCGAGLPDVRDKTLQKDKDEENDAKMFAVPPKLLTPVNSDATVSGKDTGDNVKNAVTFSKTATEPPQKRRGFHMSAQEDFFEMDDEIHSNGVLSTPVVGKDEKLNTSVIASNDFPSEAIMPSKSLALPESKTIADFGTSNGEKTVLTFSSSPDKFTESTSTLDKFTAPKEVNASPSSTIGAKTVDKVQPFASTSSVFGIESSGTKLNSPSDAKPKEVNTSPSSTIGAKNVDKVQPFASTSSVFGIEPSGTKLNSPSDAKPELSSSLVNVSSVSTNGQVNPPVFDNTTQNTVDGIRKSDTLPSSESAPSKIGIFSFGIPAKNPELNNNEKATDANGNVNSLPSASDAPPVKNGIFSFSTSAKQSDLNGSLAPSLSSSLPTDPVPSSNFLNQSFNNLGQSTTAASPIFSFVSSMPPATPALLASTSALATSTSVSETADTQKKSDLESPFSKSASSIFGVSSFASTENPFKFNSSAAPSTEKNQSQGSLFSTGSVSLSNASSASTQSASFQFGSTTTTIFPFGATSANPFSSTIASLDQTSAAPSDTTSANTFGSGWQPSKSSVFGSTFSSPSPSTGFSFGASSTAAASASSAPASSMIFGSTTAGAAASSGSPLFSFGAVPSSTASSFPNFSQTQQPVFGGGNSNPSFPAPSSMGMEDSMAEDPMNSPSPTPAFGQPPSPSPPVFGQPPSPGFMFGNPTQAPAPAPAFQGVPFQFGGQQNPAVPQNPFQASNNSLGGSFSLGSGGGGGDKSGRRMVRVSKNKNRKK